MIDRKNKLKFMITRTFGEKVRKKDYIFFGLGIKKSFIFVPTGEMAEWSKAHAWKVCNRQKRFMGSNPILSATFFTCFIAQPLFSNTRDILSNKYHFGIWTVFGLFMVLFYIGLGLFVMFFPDFNEKFNIPPQYSGIKYFFGIFLIMYGIIRFFRVLPKLKKNKDYEEE